jgi:trans-aconitate 2-methyltransferase
MAKGNVADWDPELYNRFRRFRAEPVEAILQRLAISDRENIADLGCGPGENTIELARRSQYGSALGIDSSQAMIDRALENRAQLDPAVAARLRFELGSVADFSGRGEYTLVFSNATLHWLSDHRGIFRRCFDALAPGGKMVVQMPANDGETAKLAIHQLAGESPWREKLAGAEDALVPVPPPGHYREMLGELGFDQLDCYYQTFAHPMQSPLEVIEWYSSTGLRPYLLALDDGDRAGFVAALAERLKAAYGTGGAMTFHFRRLFIWARRPAA